MLGEAFYEVFSKKYTLKCTDKDVNEDWLERLDFCDSEKYRLTVEEFSPDYLFHIGAFTDLEYCENNRQATFETNTESVKTAVKISNNLNIPLLYISTAGIFDGLKEFYDEPRKVLIDGLHGEMHKAYGELPNMVYIIDPDGKIIYRSDWAFPKKIDKILKNRDKINTDEHVQIITVIRAGYELLGLITYFTAGPKETRAWTIEENTKAPQAAGVIHTDFERGFIKAEVIDFKDFIECNGELGAKEKGKLRLEGKEYLVKDGDVIHFKFNV